jgi:hypothetical protein
VAWRDQNRRQRRENMNKSARCAPRLNAREAAENAQMLLIAAERCAEILAEFDFPKTKPNERARAAILVAYLEGFADGSPFWATLAAGPPPVLCGDSTSVDAVARLCAPGLANLVFTAPRITSTTRHIPRKSSKSRAIPCPVAVAVPVVRTSTAAGGRVFSCYLPF